MGLSSVSRPVLGPSTYHPHRPDLLGLWFNSPEINKAACLQSPTMGLIPQVQAGPPPSEKAKCPLLLLWGAESKQQQPLKNQARQVFSTTDRQNTLTLPAALGHSHPIFKISNISIPPFSLKVSKANFYDGGEELNDLVEEG